jgi:membrane fusion protein, multidrug efflux system
MNGEKPNSATDMRLSNEQALMQNQAPIQVSAAPLAAASLGAPLAPFRALLSGLLALIVLSLLVGCGRHPAQKPQTMVVQTARVESMEILRPGAEASYIAIVHAENETDLSFKIGGILDVIGPASGRDWDEGTPVKEGAVLASLKQSDFANALSSARANAELTTKVRARFRKLRDSDAISQQEMDVTEASWLTAQAQLDQAQQNLHDSQLRASIDGVVLARYVNSGVTVGAGQRVLRFADTRTMSVELGVPDRLVKHFYPGKEFAVEISALEGRPPFLGRVSEVGVAASQDSRLFRIVIKVPNPEGIIRSGMTATVRVGDLARFDPGSVRVSLSALVTFSPAAQGAGNDSPRLAVFVVNRGKATRRPVQTGDILSSSIIVYDGLKAGEEIVTSGASFLYDGAPVEVLNSTPIGD